MGHSVIHFEIPADDPEKLVEFYSKLLDWKFQKMPMDEENAYWLITTKGEGEPGVDGGMMKRQMPNQATVNYYDVESVDKYAAQVGALGGQIIVPKMAVPAMGWFAVCTDPQGNTFGLWETDESAA